MTDIADIISSVGVPSACFLLSAWFIKYSYDKQLEQNRIAADRDERHWEEISKLTAAVNNNSEALRDMAQAMAKRSEDNDV